MHKKRGIEKPEFSTPLYSTKLNLFILIARMYKKRLSIFGAKP
jgi:hypothetical protein